MHIGYVCVRRLAPGKQPTGLPRQQIAALRSKTKTTQFAIATFGARIMLAQFQNEIESFLGMDFDAPWMWSLSNSCILGAFLGGTSLA